jgi:transposase
MSLATLPLPDDPTALRDLAVDLQAELARKDIEIAANAAEIHAKTLHIEKLKMQLAVLRRARFGRSSEKLDHAIEQLELLIGELEADTGAAEARDIAGDPGARQDTGQPVKRREPIQPVRKPLPPHLPRETITHEAACTCPGCGGTVFSRIGHDEREVLEYVPSSFKVIRHIRPKLSCRACETIVQSPMPSLPIERGRPGPGLLAQVLVAKFCDHTPLHRQAGIYAREGVELDRSTLADWVGRSVFLLDPLAEAIGRHLRAGQVLHADDTTVPVLVRGRPGPAGCGWSCVMNVRSDRTFHRPPITATRRTARASTPRRCSAPAAVSFMPMATPASTVCIGRRHRTACRR